MTVHFFTIDPQAGILYAGCKDGWKRFTAPIWQQGGTAYVTTGAAITKDLKRHNFTKTQVAALDRFIESGSDNLEAWEGIE